MAEANDLASGSSDNTSELVGTSTISIPSTESVIDLAAVHLGLAILQHAALHSPAASSRFKSLPKSLEPFQTSFSPILEDFTCFPKLPPEMREKIWAFAACEQRTIKLIPKSLIGLESPRVKGQPQHPGTLQACRESRAACRKYNTRSLMRYSCQIHGSGDRCSLNPLCKKLSWIYINFDWDIFM